MKVDKNHNPHESTKKHNDNERRASFQLKFGAAEALCSEQLQSTKKLFPEKKYEQDTFVQAQFGILNLLKSVLRKYVFCELSIVYCTLDQEWRLRQSVVKAPQLIIKSNFFKPAYIVLMYYSLM